MPKNLPAQNYDKLKLMPFTGCPVTKISKSKNMKNFDTVGKSIKNVTRNTEKPMPENLPVQIYEVLKLASFPGCRIIKISKLGSMKNFYIVGKNIKR